MFSGFFGKGDQGGNSLKTEGWTKSRGVEVIEDDPDTAWGLWDSALAEQESVPRAQDNVVSASPVESGLDKLKKLGEPWALGLVSDDEFNTAKAKVLTSL